MTLRNRKKKYFFSILISGFMFFFSYGILIPELPGIVTKISSADMKGLAFTFFSLAAVLSRPLAGRLIDKVGSYSTIKIGLLVCISASLLYPFCYSIFFLLFIRFVHGISKGIVPTAMTGLVSLIAPANERSKFLGHYTIASSLGVTLGPAIGGTIAYYYGLTTLFLGGIITASVSFFIIMRIQEKHKTQKLTLKDLKISLDDLTFKDVLPISLVQLVFSFEFGILITLAPIISHKVGYANNGFFFICYGITSIGIRFFTSSLSDKYGRDKMLFLVGFGSVPITFSFAFVDSPYIFCALSSLYGISRGLMLPIMFGQIADRLTPKNRGKALSTFFVFMELGVAVGSFFGGFFHQSFFSIPFLVAGVLILLFLSYYSRIKS